MQDMSCLISEPANSPPRILRSDTASERCAVETKETKVKTMPKTTRSQNVQTKKSTQTTEKNVVKEDDRETHQSAEKSFRCKMCDVTFNANSSLLRHMRSHKPSSLGSDTDSESSTSSPKESQKGTRKRKVEHNNNGSAENSLEEDQSPTTRKKAKTINNNCISELKLSCPVCDKRDFSSSVVYEIHMEQKHPDYRRNTPVSGFNDCTFIDFSSEKFPEIAKTVCELTVHQSITEQKFRCKACSRDFPCESALDIHDKTCENKNTDMPKVKSSWKEGAAPNEETRRDDFFAQLDLQNRSPNSIDKKRSSTDFEKPKTSLGYYPVSDNVPKQFMDNSKDLADIQSILSVTTGTLFKNLTHSREQATAGKDHEQEETQDAFASEFRKMKLRGEFPCRLCAAVFPNLRALKGHNRVHLSGNGAGPYRCNMCPHSSLDKAALVRHMRTHNGDRPYECAVCNYAFTTKANCERHLRNRHSKISREDVKRSIIYHPSEDPNNDEVNTKLNISRDEMKRSQIFNSCDPEHEDDMKIDRTTPVKLPYSREQPAFPEHALNIPMPRDLSIVIPQPRDIVRAHCSNDLPIPTTSEDTLAPKIKVKGFGKLTQIPEFTPPGSDHEVENYNSDDEEKVPVHDGMAYAGEIPMDLSTSECQEDVLDLSKKKNDDKVMYESEAEDYSPKSSEYNNNNSFKPSYEKQLMMIQQQFLKNSNIDPTGGFYSNPLSQLYARGGAAFIPPFPINPYLFQHNPFLAPAVNANIMEMNDMVQKEIIKGLQLSGGSLVGMDPNNILNMALIKGRLQDMQALNNLAGNDLKPSNITVEDDVKPQPLQINTDTPTTIPFAPLASSPVMSSPKMAKKESVSSQSPNSVKMVIKNGILMPKQKQRRYRTERPFSCEYCSARFTLRSNMERHIKQQHPQHWSQRQKSAMGNFPRKNPISMVHQNLTVPSLTYDSRLNYAKSHPSSESFECESKNPAMSIMSKNYPMIPDHVKHAILAQQLKSHNSHQNESQKDEPEAMTNGEVEDEDEEDALIIDEEMVDDKSLVKKQIKAENLENAAAKKVAQEILDDASKIQHDLNKDFDFKIQGNLISKNPQAISSDIPTVVVQMNQLKNKSEEIGSDDIDETSKNDDVDLASVTSLVDAQQKMSFKNFFKNESNNDNLKKDILPGEGSEDEEEGLVAPSGSASEGNNSGSDENRSDPETTAQAPEKKKSAYSLAPNRVSCPYCSRKFPWSSSLRRHVLTHTGQKPYKCPHCPLLFTTKSNCDRHLLRKHGSNSQQTIVQVSSPPEANATSAVPIPEVNNQGFMMRNVPERPYKCAQCPSSTFSTRSNLKKHMLTKHGITIPDNGMPDSPKEPEESHSRRESSDADQMLTSDDEKSSRTNDDAENLKTEWDHQISKCSPSQVLETPSNTQNSDLPFKCHLCEGSYAERQTALDHIKTVHETEYEILVCKGALETGITFNEEMGSSISGHRSEGGEEQGGEENLEQLRGKFPDYANRKVVCAFCMRRFWSAEDLRRHMRTHTGERPFSCDVCRRRFTLKHSMLRHRKKHSASDNRSCEDMSIASGDEDAPSPSTSVSHNNSLSSSNRTISPLPNSQNTSTPLSTKGTVGTPRLTLLNTYQLAINAKNLTSSPEIPSNVNNNNSPPAQSYDGKMKIMNSRRELNPTPRTRYLSEDADAHDTETEIGSDLIGNLLGISDRGMINKLLSSADEAAKLLGVNK